MFNPATRQQQDKKMDKAAKVAQQWLQKGFTPEQVAEGVWNKVGYTTSVDGKIVKFWGCYNDEYRNWQGKRPQQFYVMREITEDSIIKH